MACSHNLAKINQIKKEILGLETEITNLSNNVSKCDNIKQKHTEFSDKIDCVMSNLSGNYVEAGKSYDSGKMLKCYVDAKNTIRDCDTIIVESNSQIKANENRIKVLEKQIESLKGNCNLCSGPSSSTV